MIKLVVFDLDETLWTMRGYVSEMVLPFKKVDNNTLVDARGVSLTLFPWVREALSFLKSKGVLIACASYNYFEQAHKALQMLGLIEFFDSLKIELCDKEVLIEQLLKEHNLKPSQVLFIDDNPEWIDDVKYHFDKQINTILFTKDLNILKLLKAICNKAFK